MGRPKGSIEGTIKGSLILYELRRFGWGENKVVREKGRDGGEGGRGGEGKAAFLSKRWYIPSLVR